jgi:hypothetical protein
MRPPITDDELELMNKDMNNLSQIQFAGIDAFEVIRLLEMRRQTAKLEAIKRSLVKRNNRIMLDDYFGDIETIKQKQRRLALQAALEVAKSSVNAGNGISGARTEYDLQSVAKELKTLTDAIQAILETE